MPVIAFESFQDTLFFCWPTKLVRMAFEAHSMSYFGAQLGKARCPISYEYTQLKYWRHSCNDKTAKVVGNKGLELLHG